jgi:hypothetical protein
MEINANSYVDISEIVGNYKPSLRLDGRIINQYLEEFGIRDIEEFSMIGYREDWLLFCNYVVECYSTSKSDRPERNKQFKPKLILWEIISNYELKKKFNAETIEKIDKDLNLTDEDIIEICGSAEEWLLFVTFMFEKYSF